jgi:NADPH-dependent glutamate synthase beta subunit-like oxidoreductase
LLVAGLESAGEGLRARGRVFACGSVVRGRCSVVQAVADGRAATRLVHSGQPA